MDTNFVLVGITERFDEFMMLLRYILNWDISDIVYLPQKVSKEVGWNYTTREMLSSRDINRIHELSELDTPLYKHAERLFEKTLQRFMGKSSFQEDMKLYKLELSRVSHACSNLSTNQQGLIGTPLSYYRCDELTWISTTYAKLMVLIQNDANIMYTQHHDKSGGWFRK